MKKRGIVFKPYSGVEVLRVNKRKPKDKENIKVNIGSSGRYEILMDVLEYSFKPKDLLTKLVKKVKNSSWSLTALYDNDEGLEGVTAVYRFPGEELNFEFNSNSLEFLTGGASMNCFHKLYIGITSKYPEKYVNDDDLDLIIAFKGLGDKFDLEDFGLSVHSRYGIIKVKYNENSLIKVVVDSNKECRREIREGRIRTIGLLLDSVVGSVSGFDSVIPKELSEVRNLDQHEIKSLEIFTDKFYTKKNL